MTAYFVSVVHISMYWLQRHYPRPLFLYFMKQLFRDKFTILGNF